MHDTRDMCPLDLADSRYDAALSRETDYYEGCSELLYGSEECTGVSFGGSMMMVDDGVFWSAPPGAAQPRRSHFAECGESILGILLVGCGSSKKAV
jgi:hypothetical protein